MATNKNTQSIADRIGVSFDSMRIAKAIAGEMGLPLFDGLRAKPAKTYSHEGSTIIELRRIISESRDKDEIRSAADAMGKMVGRLPELRDIVAVARFGSGREAMGAALKRIAARMDEVKDPAVLKLVLLNSSDDTARREAVERLSKVVHLINDSVSLIHIAQWAADKKARFTAVQRLSKEKDALKVISNHSEYEDTKEYAKSVLGSS